MQNKIDLVGKSHKIPLNAKFKTNMKVMVEGQIHIFVKIHLAHLI